MARPDEVLRGATGEDVAWAAGLFEGEGTICVSRLGHRPAAPRLMLGMTDKDVVERFARIAGFGRARRCTSPSRAGHKPFYVWDAGGIAPIRLLLAAFIPLFGERRRAKAEQLLRDCAHIRPQGVVRTHCPRGHELAGDNLGSYGHKPAADRWRCKQCRRDKHAANRHAGLAVSA